MLAKKPVDRITAHGCLVHKFLCQLGFDKTIIGAARNCLKYLMNFDVKGKL